MAERPEGNPELGQRTMKEKICRRLQLIARLLHPPNPLPVLVVRLIGLGRWRSTVALSDAAKSRRCVTYA